MSPRPEPAMGGFVAALDPDTRCADLYHLPPRGREPMVTLRPVGKRTASRFAVGRPGECSSIFRVWANKDKYDVYASIRTWKGLAKFSFHESGTYIYHLSSTDHENAKWVKRADPNNRRIDTWKKPETFVPGWTHLVSFMIPTQDILPISGAGIESPELVRWIPKPAISHSLTEIRVAIGDPGQPLIDAGSSDYLLNNGIVDGFVLCNGQIVVIQALLTAMNATARRLLDDLRAACLRDAPADFALPRSRGPRMAVPLIQPDGRHTLWDISPPIEAMTAD
ncbi:hypothetical protein [Nocardia takedensis]|uniref:hypothetical protein n=1 Tax=Nocardia takedensis TaxID=259390 RepID=UPI0012F6FDE3|nr:hypothetical protein [Nocardia takedensis]